MRLGRLLGAKPEQVARLALELAADRLERREADRLGLAGLEDRQVGERQVDPLAELGQRHAAGVEEVVELDGDRHHTVPSRSSRMAAPWRNTRARMNRVSTRIRPPPPASMSITAGDSSGSIFLATHAATAPSGIASA